jgi:hypothetical protein
MIGFEQPTSAEQEYVGWSSQPTLFSELHTLGWTSSVSGWFHPYCRVLGQQLDACSWEPGASIYDRPEFSANLSFTDSMGTVLNRQLAKVPFAGRLHLVQRDLVQRELQLREYQSIYDAAQAAIGRSDFVYVHWPVPHPYGLYDRSSGKMGVHARSSYLDNLALADRIIGEFRRLLESRGEWENATVILSSDHSLRVGEWSPSRAWQEEDARATAKGRSPYVPFIIKSAGQNRRLTCDQPFSILLVHDLILAIARGELASPEAIANWLNQNSRRYSLPAGV